MGNKTHHTVKNQREREAYHRNSRKQSKIDPTGNYGASALYGSDDSWAVNNDISSVNDIPVGKSSFGAWLSKHWIEAVVTPLVLGIIAFVGNWIFTKNADIAVIQENIKSIETRISKLEEDTITKQYFDLKIEVLKKDTQTLIPDISGIKEEIVELETRIDQLENGNKYLNP